MGSRASAAEDVGTRKISWRVRAAKHVFHILGGFLRGDIDPGDPRKPERQKEPCYNRES